MAERRIMTAQNIPEDLFIRARRFLDSHPRIRSMSILVQLAVETYLEQAEKYGIDENWKVRFPERHTK